MAQRVEAMYSGNRNANYKQLFIQVHTHTHTQTQCTQQYNISLLHSGTALCIMIVTDCYLVYNSPLNFDLTWHHTKQGLKPLRYHAYCSRTEAKVNWESNDQHNKLVAVQPAQQ